MAWPLLTDRDVLARRGPKNRLNAFLPHGCFVEPEVSSRLVLEDVAVVLLTNRECPFRCVMCDLWRNTLDEPVPRGAIPSQIDAALARLPPVRHIKLYNSGNFFDPQAIPPEDLPEIAGRVRGMATVIVENHPRLCGDSCVRFRDLLGDNCELEVALGLETAHPEALRRLNKRMTVEDFERAVRFLARHGIASRAFILLRPPLLSEDEGMDWALRSLEVAFAAGVRCGCVIPTRGGNGIMDELLRDGQFTAPRITSLETVLETALGWGAGRTFADLWDAERISGCPDCHAARRERLRIMNHEQRVPPRVACHCTVSSA